MENIDKKFNESLLHDIQSGFDYYEFTYVLPGLPRYREKDRRGSWVHDLRIGFHISKTVKVSYLVNNIANEEYSSRPGDVRPPRMQTIQIMLKL